MRDGRLFTPRRPRRVALPRVAVEERRDGWTLLHCFLALLVALAGCARLGGGSAAAQAASSPLTRGGERALASASSQPKVSRQTPHAWQLRVTKREIVFSHPGQATGIRVALIKTQGPARTALGQWVAHLRKKYPALRLAAVKLDARTGGVRVAQCDLRYGGKAGLMQDRLALSVAGGRGLVLELFAPAADFPSEQASLYRAARFLLHPSPSSSRPAGGNAALPLDQPRRFRTVVTQDGGLTAQIPGRWRVVAPSTADSFTCYSPYGEKFAFAALSIPADEQAVRRRVATFRIAGTAVSRQQVNQLFQIMSPLRSPGDAVRVMFPRLSNGAVTDLRIRHVAPLDAATRQSLAMAGMKGALAIYQYALHPQRCSAVVQALLPAAWRDRPEVPVQGAALVLCGRPQTDLVLGHTWLLIFFAAEAPPDSVRPNWPLYARIANSLRLNAALLEARLPWNAHLTQEIADWGNRMRAMQYQQFRTTKSQNLYTGEQAIAALGGESLYTSRQTGSVYRVPWDYAGWFRNHSQPGYRLGDIPDPTAPYRDPLRPARPSDIQWGG